MTEVTTEQTQPEPSTELQAFITDLEALTRKHGFTIVTGCCGCPEVVRVPMDGRYKHGHGKHLSWEEGEWH